MSEEDSRFKTFASYKVLEEVRKYDLGQKEESKFSLDEDDIPFEKCGCYFCKNESVNFDNYIKVKSPDV